MHTPTCKLLPSHQTETCQNFFILQILPLFPLSPHPCFLLSEAEERVTKDTTRQKKEGVTKGATLQHHPTKTLNPKPSPQTLSQPPSLPNRTKSESQMAIIISP